MTWITRLIVAVAATLSLALLAIAALPEKLAVTTDIVGYPTFAAFNIDVYYWTYAIVVIFVPLATLALYLVLTRVSTGRFGPWGRVLPILGQVEERQPLVGWRVPVVAAARTVFIGAVLGVEVALAIDASQFRTSLLVAGFYLTGVTLVACAMAPARDLFDVARTVNILVAPLAVGGLYFASRSTTATVGQTKEVFHHPWLPGWLAIGLVVLLSAVALTFVLSRSARLSRETLERRALLLVVAPVALFLLVSTIPGSLATINHYEEGQVLVGAELTRGGAFPWRDVLHAHGLLHDVFAGLVGFEVIEDSRWGVVAAEKLILVPLTWVGFYYLCAYLFSGNWLVLAGSQALVVTGHLYAVQIRFLLLPFVLLLLAAVLRRPSVVRVVGFTTLLGVQLIVTPEALPLGVAAFVTVVLYDAYCYERGTRPASAFKRSLLLLSVSVILAGIWSAFLASRGALDAWIFSYRAFVPGHRYTGGIPLQREFWHWWELWLPVVALLAAFAIGAVLMRLRRPLAVTDWVALAAVGLTLLYVPKGFSRADDHHVGQVFAVATPLILYVAYRIVVPVESWLAGVLRPRVAHWPRRYTVTLPLLAVLLWTAPTSAADVLRPQSSHFSVIVEREPEMERVGYDFETDNDEAMIRGVGLAVSRMLEPGESVFDFSNTPSLFHYLNVFPPSTRYSNVSIAMRQRTQSDLIERLERARPAVVVLSGGEAGMSAWDGIANQVRHYDVSQYLLDNYVPMRVSHDFVLMEQRTSGVQPNPRLYFRVHRCDWGYVPAFFAPEPSPGAGTLSLRIRPLASTGRGWALSLPEDGSAQDYRWLEVRTSVPLQQGRFDLVDRLAVRRDSNRRIVFNTLDRGETTIRVRIGSCSQWRGYRSKTLYLTSTVPQDVRAVRLVR